MTALGQGEIRLNINRWLLVFSLAILPGFSASAKQAGEIPRLCFLTFDPGPSRAPRFNPFFESLRGLGYVEGKTIAIDYLSADSRAERYPEIAAECLRRKADVIVVSTTPAAQAARKATRTTPIVMLALGDPPSVPV
jgi:putative ABC transport system substrate-binding protein